MLATLFVYGSLLSASSHPNARRLAGEAVYLGQATVAGRLYAIEWYPGLVDGAGELAVGSVTGEVYRLADPVRTLAWLDLYEGLVPGTHAGLEYVRAVRPAYLVSGETLDAWTYLFTADVGARSAISDGRWSLPRALPADAFSRD